LKQLPEEALTTKVTISISAFEKNETFRVGGKVARWHKFLIQKSQFWSILEGLEIENVRIFYDHLVYITAICYMYIPVILVYFMAVLVIYCLFGIFFSVLVYCIKKTLATLVGGAGKKQRGQKISLISTLEDPNSSSFPKSCRLQFSCPGLPDFSLYNLPKRGKIYQITT
jgi:hypothetical protein